MFVYKITNTINNKVYIGQTVNTIKKRFYHHISKANNPDSDTHLSRAMRKYGVKNFTIECIDEAKSQEELTQKEHYWIQYYDSCNPNNGYNVADGTYKYGGDTYHNKTENEMNIIKDKIRFSKLGDNNPNAKKIKCFNINTKEELVFGTLAECQKYYNEKTHRFITTRVTGVTRGLYKKEWAIAYLGNPYIYDEVVHKKGRRMQVTNTNDNTTKIYESIRYMCKELGLSRSKITEIIRSGETTFILENYQINILD